MKKEAFVVGISGGSGSGKTYLARWLAQSLAPHAVLFSEDWYYYDKSNPKPGEVLNFDHPRSIENSFMVRQLKKLMKGKMIEAPQYEYLTHKRLDRTHSVLPQKIIIVEGLFVFHFANVFKCLDLSIFIDVPADLRLSRRIQRDLAENRNSIKDTLNMYLDNVRPMHEKFIQPAYKNASLVWDQMGDPRFPNRLLKDLKKKI